MSWRSSSSARSPNTLLIERALSLGNEDDTTTTQHRTVRLLAPRKADLQEWRLAQGR